MKPVPGPVPPPARALAAVALACVATACGGRLPFTPFYTPARVAESRAEVRLDVPYRTDPGADPDKHRLDLYLPRSREFPMLAFVHGGSLENGDSAKRIAGHDIYRNIGRFYAARGVGVALVNYRLQPEVTWPDQVDDVAEATAFLLARLEALGGDGRLFLSGHSAGSWLAAHVAVDADVRRAHGIDPAAIAAVVSVSGSGFDLTDARTWEMFGHEKRWRRRFSTDGSDPDESDEAWKRRASVVSHLDADAPPFVLLYSSREWEALERQNRLMCEALEAVRVRCDLHEIEGEGHRRMVLAMSDPDRAVSERVLSVLGVGGLTLGDAAAPP